MGESMKMTVLSEFNPRTFLIALMTAAESTVEMTVKL
jgi:hypothetical protein